MGINKIRVCTSFWGCTSHAHCRSMCANQTRKRKVASGWRCKERRETRVLKDIFIDVTNTLEREIGPESRWKEDGAHFIQKVEDS